MAKSILERAKEAKARIQNRKKVADAPEPQKPAATAQRPSSDRPDPRSSSGGPDDLSLADIEAWNADSGEAQEPVGNVAQDQAAPAAATLTAAETAAVDDATQTPWWDGATQAERNTYLDTAASDPDGARDLVGNKVSPDILASLPPDEADSLPVPSDPSTPEVPADILASLPPDEADSLPVPSDPSTPEVPADILASLPPAEAETLIAEADTTDSVATVSKAEALALEHFGADWVNKWKKSETDKLIDGASLPPDEAETLIVETEEERRRLNRIAAYDPVTGVFGRDAVKRRKEKAAAKAAKELADRKKKAADTAASLPPAEVETIAPVSSTPAKPGPGATIAEIDAYLDAPSGQFPAASLPPAEVETIAPVSSTPAKPGPGATIAEIDAYLDAPSGQFPAASLPPAEVETIASVSSTPAKPGPGATIAEIDAYLDAPSGQFPAASLPPAEVETIASVSSTPAKPGPGATIAEIDAYLDAPSGQFPAASLPPAEVETIAPVSSAPSTPAVTRSKTRTASLPPAEVETIAPVSSTPAKPGPGATIAEIDAYLDAPSGQFPAASLPPAEVETIAPVSSAPSTPAVTRSKTRTASLPPAEVAKKRKEEADVIDSASLPPAEAEEIAPVSSAPVATRSEARAVTRSEAIAAIRAESEKQPNFSTADADEKFFTNLRASDLNDPAVLDRPVFANGQKVGTLGDLTRRMILPVSNTSPQVRAVNALKERYEYGGLSLSPLSGNVSPKEVRAAADREGEALETRAVSLSLSTPEEIRDYLDAEGGAASAYVDERGLSILKRSREAADKKFFTNLSASDLDDPAVLNRPAFANGRETGTLGGLIQNVLRGGWEPLSKSDDKARGQALAVDALKDAYEGGALSIHPTEGITGHDIYVVPALRVQHSTGRTPENNADYRVYLDERERDIQKAVGEGKLLVAKEPPSWHQPGQLLGPGYAAVLSSIRRDSSDGPLGILHTEDERHTRKRDLITLPLDFAPLPAGYVARGAVRARRMSPLTKVDFREPFTGERLVVKTGGGYVEEATPADHVAKLIIKQGPEGERISQEVIDQIATTGRYDGVIGNTHVKFRESPLVEGVRGANRDTPLFFHVTPAGDVVASGPISKAKPGMGAAEEHFFVSPDVNPHFMGGAAFGGGGTFPGIHVYTPKDVADVGSRLVPVREADGTIKYWRKGYEAEKGIPTGSQIPPTESLAAAGIQGGQLYGSASVKPTSALGRTKVNLETFLPGNKNRGKFQFKQADPAEVKKRLDDADDLARKDEQAKIDDEADNASLPPDEAGATRTSGIDDAANRARIDDEAREAQELVDNASLPPDEAGASKSATANKHADETTVSARLDDAGNRAKVDEQAKIDAEQGLIDDAIAELDRTPGRATDGVLRVDRGVDGRVTVGPAKGLVDNASLPPAEVAAKRKEDETDEPADAARVDGADTTPDDGTTRLGRETAPDDGTALLDAAARVDGADTTTPDDGTTRLDRETAPDDGTALLDAAARVDGADTTPDDGTMRLDRETAPDDGTALLDAAARVDGAETTTPERTPGVNDTTTVSARLDDAGNRARIDEQAKIKAEQGLIDDAIAELDRTPGRATDGVLRVDRGVDGRVTVGPARGLVDNASLPPAEVAAKRKEDETDEPADAARVDGADTTPDDGTTRLDRETAPDDGTALLDAAARVDGADTTPPEGIARVDGADTTPDDGTTRLDRETTPDDGTALLDAAARVDNADTTPDDGTTRLDRETTPDDGTALLDAAARVDNADTTPPEGIARVDGADTTPDDGTTRLDRETTPDDGTALLDAAARVDGAETTREPEGAVPPVVERVPPIVERVPPVVERVPPVVLRGGSRGRGGSSRRRGVDIRRPPPPLPARVPESPARVPESPARVPESPARVPESPARVPESPPARVPESPPARVPESPPARVPESPPARVPESPARVPESPARVPESPARVPAVLPRGFGWRRSKNESEPETRGEYPAVIEHRGDVIVQTDLNTGEHTAKLVELKDVPKVISYQESPATTKKIEGRTLDVNVLSDGGVHLTAQDQIGPHTIVERGKGSVAPNYDIAPDAVPEAAPPAAAAEASDNIFLDSEEDEGGILDTAASGREPEDAPSPDDGAERASESIIEMAGSETQSEQGDNAFRDLEMDDDAGVASAASEENANRGTDNLMDEANNVIDHSVDSTLDEGAAEEDENLIDDGPSPDLPSAGDALRELAGKVGNSGNTPPAPQVPSDGEGEEAAQARAGEEEAAFAEGYQQASEQAQAAGVPLPDLSQAQAENRRIIAAGMSPEERSRHMADWYAAFLKKTSDGEAPDADPTPPGDQASQDGEKVGGFLSGLLGGGEPKSRFRAVSDIQMDVSEAVPEASGEPSGSLSGQLRRRKMQEERRPRKVAPSRSGGARGKRGMVPRL